MLASEAIRDGFSAATNAVHGAQLPVTDHLIPAGSFTDPEYASVGLTEGTRNTQRHNSGVLLAGIGARNDRRELHRIVQADCRPRRRRDPRCHVVGEQATNVVQVASIALAAGTRRADGLAHAAVSFPMYAEY